MAEALKKFGKYFLLDQIAQGGMAEIYRARMATPDGGGRLLAIKKVIASYSSNPEFAKMFKDEVIVTSGFTHPNIVQLYDYGEEDGMLYIAMEIVDGKNLRQFISRFAELKSMFPVEVSVYIMEQAAHGMAYAHSFKDKFSGKCLNIVHRDISPQNILISFDGAVKVIDFGIAKAVTNSESTRAGVIKGKPSYLSPEQISGEVLDGRSDIFALGIVLWELLTGKKLFASDNDYGVLKLIENCTTHVKPPSMYNPKIPKELDAIVMKTLQKNRDQRYATAEEMQRALHKFLYQFAPEFNPADLAYYARDLFKNEIVEDRKRLLKLNEKVEQLLANEVPEKPAAPAGAAPIHAQEPSAPEKHESTIALSKSDEDAEEAAAKAAAKKVQKKREETSSFRVVELNKKEKTNVTLDFGTTPVKPANQNSLTAKQGQGPAGGYANASAAANRSQATRTGSTQPGFKKPAEAKTKSPMVAVLLIALAGAAYYYYDNSTTREPAGQTTAPVASGPTLVIQGNVKAATITVDEKPVGNALPAYLKGLPAGRSFKLVVTANGYKKFAQDVTLAAGETKNLSVNLLREDGTVDPNAAPTSPGAADSGKTITLRVTVSPLGVGTTIKLNGSAIDVSGITTAPMDRSLDITVEREGFRTYRQTFTIESAKVAGKSEYAMDVSLQQAKFGYISIKTTPSADAILVIDGIEEKWTTPVSRKRIPVGAYKARLVNSLLGMEKEVSFTVGEDRFTNIEERLSVSGDSGRVPSNSQ